MVDPEYLEYFNQDQEDQAYQSRQLNYYKKKLKGADFIGAILEGAIFKGAILEGAKFRGADLRGADFTGADLRGADFTGADLRWAIFIGANLERANFTGADLEGALIPMNETKKAIGIDTTKVQKIEKCNENGYDNGRGSMCNIIYKMLGWNGGKKQRLAKRKTNKRNIKLCKNKTNRHKVNLRKNKTNRHKVSLRKNKTNKKH